MSLEATAIKYRDRSISKRILMKGLFASQDSKFAIRTALLVTLVPSLMIALVIYSVWLLISLNFSYFLASGIPLDQQNTDVFMNYLIQTQLDYLPYVGLFFIAVFFIGLFLSHIILRPFNELIEMCHEIKNAKGEKIKIVGLEKSKLLIKLGDFICSYADARKNQKTIPIPVELQKIQKPAMDYVFYFQFFCIIVILMFVATSSIYLFANQLHESIIQTAIEVLKAPKGMSTFLASQETVFDLIVLVPSLLGGVLYFIIARLIISKIQGVTYAYVRDVCEVARGNTKRRLSPRSEDPGREAAAAVNEVLDLLHPQPQSNANESVSEGVGGMTPSKA